MATKTSTQQSINYDPQSMAQYQSFWQMASPLLNGMATNPFTSPSYQLNLGQATQAAQQSGSMAMQNALANLNTAGMGQTNSGLRAGLMSQLGRYGSNLNYQGFLSAANQAQSNQWNALGMQASRSPLQTGQSTTQQQSGLGTWLPQLISTGIGAALGGLTGSKQGLGSLFGGASAGNAMGPLPTTGTSQAGVTPLSSPLSSFNSLAGYFSPGSGGVGTANPASMQNPLSSYFPQGMSQ